MILGSPCAHTYNQPTKWIYAVRLGTLYSLLFAAIWITGCFNHICRSEFGPNAMPIGIFQ
ncbi:hypothetical protein K438DRAFT_1799455 [Mycena galopus ATCC 62051]|nr:hypothetical protein K438DRAFT_1799455 [Mycena galopus ATCC 62051]